MMKLIDADQLLIDNGLDKCIKYGNETAEQRDRSYSTMMLYEIADMINDAPAVEDDEAYIDALMDTINKKDLRIIELEKQLGLR